jgi:hypothetical protein
MRRRWIVSRPAACALSLILALSIVGPGIALSARQPLLMEGKKTLFQRVLTRPGAALVPEPGETQGRPVPPLSVFYVYDRVQRADGSEWLELGSNSAGQTRGWVAAQSTIAWRQALALSFANPAGREPVLFFRDEPALLDLVESDELKDRLAAVRAEIAKSGLSARPEVIAREPDTYVDIRKQFYLLPILSAHETILASGFRAKSVEVAAVTASDPVQESAAADADGGLSDFSAAVVFVIDASTSMGPYIAAAREAVARIYARIESSDLAGKVRFGLVGYRDDPGAVEGVEYLTRIFVDPAEASDGKSFLARAAALEPSKVSTRSFEEDGLAGVMAALEGVDWMAYGGRYVVFITDASSRGGAHPFSSTGLGPEQVRERALQDYVALYAMHLRTPEGQKDHAAAERQYRTLTDYPGVGSLYFPVQAGDVELFRRNVDALANAVVDQVAAAARGAPAAGASAAQPEPKDQEEELRRKVAQLGHAMRLIWLGRAQKSGAPPLIRAWAVDRDLDNPAVQALEVRVLLTKNQLSDMQAALREIVSVGIATETSRSQFFDRLRSAVAALSRDPNQVGKSEAATLQELGLLGEYLEDLPYRSRVLALDEATWNRWSIGEQVAFLDDLSARIRLYQRFHDDVDNWIALDGGGSPGDAVYPVPLSALP